MAKHLVGIKWYVSTPLVLPHHPLREELLVKERYIMMTYQDKPHNIIELVLRVDPLEVSKPRLGPMVSSLNDQNHRAAENSLSAE